MRSEIIKKLRELLTGNPFDDACGGFVSAYGDDLLAALTWQPIATAPKDGRDLWLYTPNDEPTQVVGYWAESWGGWNWRDSILADMAAEEMAPTHWMPLPESPE